MRGYPQFSFWISLTLVKIYIFRIIVNWGKHTFELVGTILKGVINLKAKVAEHKQCDDQHRFFFAFDKTEMYPNPQKIYTEKEKNFEIHFSIEQP